LQQTRSCLLVQRGIALRWGLTRHGKFSVPGPEEGYLNAAYDRDALSAPAESATSPHSPARAQYPVRAGL
jgi:hypothetical protein